MKILFLNGALTGQTMDLSPAGTTIGRENDNAIQLPKGGVSRYHAKIECDADGKWVIRDLGSTNGTLVDDVPVSGSTELVNGSVISIGDQLLRCVDSDAAAGENPSSPRPAPAAAPSQPQPNPAPSPAGGQQPAFFFRPKNLAATPSPLSTAQIQGSAQTSEPASPSAPTIASVSTDVPKLFVKKESETKKQDRRKKLLGNIIFFLILILVVIAVLGIYLKLNAAPGAENDSKPAVEQPQNPFFLYYEKKSLSGTHMFRFSLLVEMREYEQADGQGGTTTKRGYFMEATLDEPQQNPADNRSFSSLSPKAGDDERFKNPIPDELIKTLKEEIDKSGFMQLQQERLAGGVSGSGEHKRIAVGFENKFCDVRVTDDVSETFGNVEAIINSTLLEAYDLGEINEEARKILQKANDYLVKGDDAFLAVELDPSKLVDSINNYKYAKHLYEFFDPEPAGYRQAKESLDKAQKMLDEIVGEANKKVNRLISEQKYMDAVNECDRILNYFPPGSERYRKISKIKSDLQEKLSRRNK